MSRPSDNTIAKNIVDRMKALGITQKNLAEVAGVSHPAIHYLISGKTERSKYLPEIAQALSCTVEELCAPISSEHTITNPEPRNTIAKNIVDRMKALRLTQTELAEAAGLSQASLNLIISGKTKRTRYLPDIAWALKCTVEELEGRCTPITAKAETAVSDIISIPFCSVEFSAEHDADDSCSIQPYIIQQMRLDQLGVSASVAVVAKVQDKSMQPDLFNGDIILINSIKTTPVSGKLYAFEFDGDLKVKRFLKRLDGSWQIISTNDNKALYPDETLAPYNIGSLRIIGQVVALLERRLD